jgi:hypothetical protein
VFTLVRRARRRLFRNELLSQGANAVSVAMAAFILLLLFGTQILEWQWLVLIPLCTAAAGFYLARRKLPSLYVVAQLIDHRLGLADTLSTALFFQRPGAPAANPEVRRLQSEAAERVAASADARQAVPYTLPRTAYLMAALVLVASSLFALRYGLNRSLDIRPPLARILQQTFGFPERTKEARNNRRALPPQAQQHQQDDQTTLDAEQAEQPDSDPEAASELPRDSQTGKGDKKNSAENQSKQQEQADRSKSEDQEGQPGDESADDASQQGGKASNPKGSKQDSASRQDTNSENSSLLSKVKDAMQNLLSRMKPQSNQSGGQQSSTEQSSKQGNGQQSGSKQQSAKNGQQQSSGQQAGDQEGQSGDQAENSQDPQGKGTGKNDSQQASKQPGSGVGSQDGDKSIRQAEQLAAMGKISEIIGKRAANISGETTVEVQSTSQALHTPYAQRGAQHSQGGAEINRDEVPVALQGYVEQYFEQVRRQAPPAKK